MTARGVLLETPGAWSEPMHWPLRAGEQKLLTVGSDADWSISDGALLPVHATLYFDGASLCVAAAPGALLNGHPMGQEWCPLALPAQLSLGETRITLAPAEPVVEQVHSPVAERARVELDSLKERTTVMMFPDLERLRASARLARAAQVAPEAPPRAVPPAMDVTQVMEVERVTPTVAFQSPFHDPDQTLYAMPALSPPMPPAEPPPLAPKSAEPAPPALLAAPPAPLRSSALESFRSASWPKRLTVLLLPVVIGLYGLKAVRASKAARTPAPRSSTAKPSPSASAARAVAPPQTATVLTPPVVPSGDPRPSGLTLQRRAVDAFASGNFREAAALYQRLASERPSERAFAVAARLASERANGVPPR